MLEIVSTVGALMMFLKFPLTSLAIVASMFIFAYTRPSAAKAAIAFNESLVLTPVARRDIDDVMKQVRCEALKQQQAKSKTF